VLEARCGGARADCVGGLRRNKIGGPSVGVKRPCEECGRREGGMGVRGVEAGAGGLGDVKNKKAGQGAEGYGRAMSTGARAVPPSSLSPVRATPRVEACERVGG
jgi:hypothetical protein